MCDYTNKDNFRHLQEEYARFQDELRVTIRAQQEKFDSLKTMMTKLIEKKEIKHPRATNSLRRKRRKIKSSSRSSDNDEITNSDTLPELVKKYDNENRQLSELVKCLKATASQNIPQ